MLCDRKHLMLWLTVSLVPMQGIGLRLVVKMFLPNQVGDGMNMGR